jgi:hypothetical protein
MNLSDYFEKKPGLGILATANSDGIIDGAPYSKPHFEDENTVTFIMADRLSHKNLESNPRATFIFKEDGSYEGKRLFLSKTKEVDDADMINALMLKYHPNWYEAYKEKKKFLVYFKIDKILPLIISEES